MPIAILPPNQIAVATNAVMRNALIAVINHHQIIVKTPVTRYTAVSRHHTQSASAVPIATIKVTYVVDKGSFIDVANAIKILATVRLTDARIRSNAGACLCL
jgi:hypothetical protein